MNEPENKETINDLMNEAKEVLKEEPELTEEEFRQILGKMKRLENHRVHQAKKLVTNRRRAKQAKASRKKNRKK